MTVVFPLFPIFFASSSQSLTLFALGAEMEITNLLFVLSLFTTTLHVVSGTRLTSRVVDIAPDKFGSRHYLNPYDPLIWNDDYQTSKSNPLLEIGNHKYRSVPFTRKCLKHDHRTPPDQDLVIKLENGRTAVYIPRLVSEDYADLKLECPIAKSSSIKLDFFNLDDIQNFAYSHNFFTTVEETSSDMFTDAYRVPSIETRFSELFRADVEHKSNSRVILHMPLLVNIAMGKTNGNNVANGYLGIDDDTLWAVPIQQLFLVRTRVVLGVW